MDTAASTSTTLRPRLSFTPAPSTFPYLYDFSLNAVLYYYPDPAHPGRYTRNPRYFYNFATHQIITM